MRSPMLGRWWCGSPLLRPPPRHCAGIHDSVGQPYNGGMSPSANGRTARGRFAKGNPGGPGNPHARRVAALRTALLASVTERDVKQVAQALVKRAKQGDVPAVRELLDRLLGKAGDITPDDAGPPIIHVITGVPRADDEVD